MLRLPKLRQTQERTTRNIDEDNPLLSDKAREVKAREAAYSAKDPDTAIDAVKQIPDTYTTQRILASVDIYEIYKDAMSEQSRSDLREAIMEDVIKFSGERLPDDVATLVGIPEKYIEKTPATGVVDFTDIEAVFRAWDTIDRGDTMTHITEALIEQYEEANNGNRSAAALLEKAFALSRENGSKAH